MPMRYAVELTRAAFYAGTPGYAPGGDRPARRWTCVVIAALTAVFMITGSGWSSTTGNEPADRQASIQDAGERAQVARVALPLAQQPVLGAPEQVRVQGAGPPGRFQRMHWL